MPDMLAVVNRMAVCDHFGYLGMGHCNKCGRDEKGVVHDWSRKQEQERMREKRKSWYTIEVHNA